MKQILFVIPTLRMGGAEKSLISLLKALDPTRVQVDLFLFEEGGVLQAEVPSWVNVLEGNLVTRAMTLELRNYLKDLIRAGQLRAAAARIGSSVRSKLSRKPQFYWGAVKKYIPALPKSYDVAVGFLEGAADFFVLEKVTAAKKIGWIHSDLSRNAMHPAEKEGYLAFDRLVTISAVCKDGFVQQIPDAADKMDVLENIVLPEDVLQKAAQPCEGLWKDDGRTHLVSVGRLDRVKGMDIAAKAAAILTSRGLSICWHVYGEGVMRAELEQYIEEKQLQETFILEGLRPNPYPYMKRADILVQPSRVEGKSLVLDEAKILGKPIVATAYPSVTDQITHEETGLIAEIDPRSIADAVERLIKDPSLRQRLAQNAAAEPNRSSRTTEAFYKMIEA